ncbi:MAG: D-alanyl-D-alanine carboxypeptidase [Nocardioidaceae bacterium]
MHDQHDARRRVSTGDQPRLDADERGGVSIWLVLVVVLLAISVSLALYVDQRADVANSPQSKPSFSSTEPPLAVPGLDLAAPPPAAPVLPPVDPASIPTVSAAALRQALQDTLASPDLGRHVGYAVAELGSPELLIATDIDDAFTPASTLKLLTTTAALEALGPNHRFVTSVVSGARPDALVLVGGGDPLLTAVRPAAPESSPAFPEVASLDDLAAQVARRLRSDGIRTVSMTYDDSLFTGPAANPAWEPSYIPESIVSPVSALWVDEGRTDLEDATRVRAPAAYAAQRFAELLAERGVSVRGVTTRGVSVQGVTARGVTAPGVAREGRAPDSAEEMARVESAPLAEIVQHIIEFSDNEASEVLLRHVAIAAGSRGSSVKGVEAMTTTLAELGVDLPGAEIFDGSGLSRRFGGAGPCSRRRLAGGRCPGQPSTELGRLGTARGRVQRQLGREVRRVRTARPWCGAGQDRDPHRRARTGGNGDHAQGLGARVRGDRRPGASREDVVSASAARPRCGRPFHLPLLMRREWKGADRHAVRWKP